MYIEFTDFQTHNSFFSKNKEKREKNKEDVLDTH